MPSTIKDSCILIRSSSNKDARRLAIDAYHKLKERNFNVFLDTLLSKGVDDANKICIDDKIDFIFVFGGDGTILKTYASWKNIPILGVNCGRVGFLTEIAPDEFESAIKKLEKKEYFVETNSTLAVSTKTYPTISAANDVIVTSDKIGQMILLRIEVNDKFLYTVHGDGLIIASCVGSSAYSLSAGGSLIMPQVDAFTLVPICPFSKRVIPIVVPSTAKITVKNLSKYRAGKVVIDGQSYYSLGYKETIKVEKSNESIGFVRFSESYVSRVREKLLRFNPDDKDE
ncbi:MAG: NAD(+)/NADH kinase [Candidatus Heimdallarchaeota archaeon]|nr:NAD(+)/NADH kinase [Candidatus Heimdallarchaeota archaeon]MCK4877948.1 NAD(+)/NADH kinase [Candidatus Heimdallarchaeota archaeon]